MGLWKSASNFISEPYRQIVNSSPIGRFVNKDQPDHSGSLGSYGDPNDAWKDIMNRQQTSAGSTEQTRYGELKTNPTEQLTLREGSTHTIGGDKQLNYLGSWSKAKDGGLLDFGSLETEGGRNLAKVSGGQDIEQTGFDIAGLRDRYKQILEGTDPASQRIMGAGNEAVRGLRARYGNKLNPMMEADVMRKANLEAAYQMYDNKLGAVNAFKDFTGSTLSNQMKALGATKQLENASKA